MIDAALCFWLFMVLGVVIGFAIGCLASNIPDDDDDDDLEDLS